jgi:anaerobic magnesium-protoporphyrin IX monomethyl ester cyclase
MSLDVLLTYPADGLRLFQSLIPIGLVSIGTVLKEAGYSVKIIDFNHYYRDFRRDLRRLSPKIIGIGGTTPSRKGSFLTARLVKAVNPRIPVVYGGVNATFSAAETLKDVPFIDYIIKGEGELSFLSLCDALLKKRGTATAIPGLCFRAGQTIAEIKRSGYRIFPFCQSLIAI